MSNKVYEYGDRAREYGVLTTCGPARVRGEGRAYLGTSAGKEVIDEKNTVLFLKVVLRHNQLPG